MNLSAQTRSFRSGIADLVLSDCVASVWVMAGRVVKRAFKYRFYPTVVQADQVEKREYTGEDFAH
ncbi:hypothetical protein M2275_002371 [Rhodococcus opacus]|nr:hypothetical protein [Rhodococcus opacus]